MAPRQRQLLAAMARGASTFAEFNRETGWPIGVTLDTLSSLEHLGLIRAEVGPFDESRHYLTAGGVAAIAEDDE